MIINKHHLNQRPHIIMTIINIHKHTLSTLTLLQLNNTYNHPIQVKEKIHHTMINIIFNTHQSFIHLHTTISNYSQKVFKVSGLKDHFRQSSSIIHHFKMLKQFHFKTNQTRPIALTKHMHHSHMFIVV